VQQSAPYELNEEQADGEKYKEMIEVQKNSKSDDGN
jgi:hypothetical protein